MRDVRLPPASEQLILGRSSVFSDLATFANYVLRLQKVCFFIGSQKDWLTPAVRHVERGIKKCRDVSFKLPNFIRIQLLLRIIRRELTGSEFAQACWMSFLFAFRVPSESLQLTRAYRNDEINACSPQREKAIIGIRTSPDGCILVAKLKWRKNITGGCILRRPCFCQGDRPASVACCPVHSLWPAIRARVPPGAPLFSAVDGRYFNNILRAVLTRSNVDEASRFSSYGFRRGAAQELKETGSHWAVVASAGLWKSPAFRGYVDLPDDVEQGVRNLVVADSDFNSDADAA